MVLLSHEQLNSSELIVESSSLYGEYIYPTKWTLSAKVEVKLLHDIYDMVLRHHADFVYEMILIYYLL